MTASTDNYYVGKGILSFKKTGDTDFTDLGNVSECEFSFNINKLDHFSSRAGVKSKDKSVIIEKGATVRMVMEELTLENMALALGGTVVTATDGSKSFGMMNLNAIEGTLKYHGTNQIGPAYDWEGKVSFAPSGSFNPISDEWGSIEVTGEILVDENGDFGTLDETGGYVMAGLLDIAATRAVVEVRGTEVEVFGISAEGLAYLMRFDEIKALLSGKEVALDIETLSKTGPKALAAIISCGASLRAGEPPRPGNAEAEMVAAALTLDEQAGLLAEILAQTFPRGLGPFAADIQKLAGAVGGMSADGTRELDTTSP